MKLRISDLWAGQIDTLVKRRFDALARHIDENYNDAVKDSKAAPLHADVREPEGQEESQG